MSEKIQSPEDFIRQLPDDRKESMEELRKTIKSNLPKGFEETISSGMLSYVVPHSYYPEGYHVNSEEPLPFISLASQKNHIAFYHLGVYIFPDILKWFEEEYAERVPTKLDMGKSCIRFKNTKNIPYDLVAELSQKISPEDYIKQYEEALKK